MSQPSASERERHLATYNQNSEHFRGLNSQMWQIPIIGMTLTGGLWFGVSNVKDSPLFQMGLLLLAAAGNIALILVLFRLRFVMGAYLKWLNDNEPSGRINADGTRFFEQSMFVRTVFQIVLLLAAVISLILLAITAAKAWTGEKPDMKSLAGYYDSYAAMIGDENEVPDFADAYPQLAASLTRSRPLVVLDIGSGGMRDARTLAAMGHRVLVASLSSGLTRLSAQSDGTGIWRVNTSLPDLSNIRGARRFDIILFNGAWAHVPSEQRQRVIDRLIDLLRPGGRLYITFRDGPADPGRTLFVSSISEIRRLAATDGVTLTELNPRPDVAGRQNVIWRSALIQLAGRGQ